MLTPKLLYTVDEACDALSLGRTKFYQEMRAGRIATVKRDGTRLVTEGQLRDYVARLVAAADAHAKGAP